MAFSGNEKLLYQQPQLSLCIPNGKVDPLASPDFRQCTRDYLVQGELLLFYLFVEFDKTHHDDLAKQRAAAQSIQLTQDLYKRSTFKIEFFHTTKATTKKGNTPMKEAPTRLDFEQNGRYVLPNPCTHSPDSVISYVKEKLIDNSLTAIVLPSGDLLIPLQTIVSLKDVYVDQTITLAVETVVQSPNLNVDEFLDTLTFKESNPPRRSVKTRVKLLDPLAVSFTSTKVYGAHMVTAQLENISNTDLTISSADIFIIGHKSNKAISYDTTDASNHFSASILHCESLFPITLMPKEVVWVVIEVFSLPAPQTLDNSQIKPSLVLTWGTDALLCEVKSQFSIPFPHPNRSRIMLSYSLEQSPIRVGAEFSLTFEVTNLSDETRFLIIELPEPTLDQKRTTEFTLGDRSREVSKSFTNQNTEQQEKIRQQYLSLRSEKVGLFCYDKVIYVGKLDPYGKISVKTHIMALHEGVYVMANTKLFDKRGLASTTSSGQVEYTIEDAFEIVVVK